MTLSSFGVKTWRCLNKLKSFFLQRENFRTIHKSDIYENWNLMFDGFEVDRNLLLFFPSSTSGTQCEHFMSSNVDGDFSVLISFQSVLSAAKRRSGDVGKTLDRHTLRCSRKIFMHFSSCHDWVLWHSCVCSSLCAVTSRSFFMELCKPNMLSGRIFLFKFSCSNLALNVLRNEMRNHLEIFKFPNEKRNYWWHPLFTKSLIENFFLE